MQLAFGQVSSSNALAQSSNALASSSNALLNQLAFGQANAARAATAAAEEEKQQLLHATAMQHCR